MFSVAAPGVSDDEEQQPVRVVLFATASLREPVESAESLGDEAEEASADVSEVVPVRAAVLEGEGKDQMKSK